MAEVILNNEHTLDLTGVPTLPITFSLADIRNPAERNSEYSREITLPASDVNNIAFTHAHHPRVNSAENKIKTLFDVNIKQNGTSVFRGKFRAKAVTDLMDRARKYDGMFFGDAANWYNELSTKYLADIPFNGHTYDAATIAASWDYTGAISDYFYPVISYGAWKNNNYIAVEDLRPAIFVYRLFYRAFTTLLGYDIISDTLTSDIFYRYFIPYFGNFIYTQDEIDGVTFLATKTSSQNISDTSELAIFTYSDLNNGNHYDTGASSYTVPYNGYFAFRFKGDITTIDSSGNSAFVIVFEYCKNDVPYATVSCGVFAGTVSRDTTIDSDLYGGGRVDGYFETGDIFTLRVFAVFNNAFQSAEIAIGAYLTVYPSDKIMPGGTISMSGVLDKTIPAAEIIMDIAKAFNLYFLTDEKRKRIYIETRKDFYYPKDFAVDWTHKIDISHPSEKDELTSTFNRTWNFRWAQDSSDKMVERWEGKNREAYLSVKVDMSEGFPVGENSLDIKHIAPTITFSDNIISPTSADMPQIWQEEADGDARPEFSTDISPRILYYEGKNMTKEFYWLTAGNNVYGFPTSYAVPPTLSSTPALAFNDYDNNQEGLVSNYHSEYISTVNEGYLLRCHAWITATDIASLRDDGSGKSLWRKLIWIRNGYFTLNQITDYDVIAQGEQLVECEFMQYFPASAIPVVRKRKYSFDNFVDGGIAPFPQEPKFFPATGVDGYFQSDTESWESRTVASVVLANGTGNQAPAGQGAKAMGVGTVAIKPYQTIDGTYNLPHEDAIFQYGNGTKDIRSNAFELRRNAVSGITEIWVDGVKIEITAAE